MWQVRNPPPLPVGHADTGCMEAARRALGEVGHESKHLGHIRLGDNCFVVSAGEGGLQGTRPLGCPRRGLAVIHEIVRLALQPGDPPTWAVGDITMLGGAINPELPPETFYPREAEVGPVLT